MIYELVMENERYFDELGALGHRIGGPIFVKTTSRTRTGRQMRPWAYQAATPPLAIAFTCRQIYPEATRVWYSSVKFTFRWAEPMEAFLHTITKDNLNAIRYIELFAGHNYSDTLEPDYLSMLGLVMDLKGLRMLDIDTGCACGNPKWKAWKEIAVSLLEIGHSLQRVTVLGSTDWKRKTEMENGKSRFLRQASILTLNENNGKVTRVRKYIKPSGHATALQLGANCIDM